MEFITISADRVGELWELHALYKEEIGEERPSDDDLAALSDAVRDGRILFFGCLDQCRLVGCCSVSTVFSTFDYRTGGVFEDFYILPSYRHKGIARQLVRFAHDESGVSTMTVGCADCDRELYMALGFRIALGNMLSYGD